MCRNLSPTVIARLTKEWQADYGAWQKRNLLPRRYVCVWADVVYLKARMEESAGCMLVLIGSVRRAGASSSLHQRRGLKIAPDLAVSVACKRDRVERGNSKRCLGRKKVRDNLDLVGAHQRWRVAAAFDLLNSGEEAAALHRPR
jgi:Transposase, Mutator family